MRNNSEEKSTREVQPENPNISVLGTTRVVRVRVWFVAIVANKLDLLGMSATAIERLVPSSTSSVNAGDNEGNEQDAASRGQGDNRNEQGLLLSLEVLGT